MRPRPKRLAARSRFRPTRTTPRRSTSSPRWAFRRPLEVSHAVRRWLAGEYRSLKSEFARTHLAELVPVLSDHLARSENPDQALVALDRFLDNLHGGARLLSLLRRNPILLHCSRWCSAMRRGSPTSWRCIRM
jgi:glutamine synthetase adenylyltransferase